MQRGRLRPNGKARAKPIAGEAFAPKSKFCLMTAFGVLEERPIARKVVLCLLIAAVGVIAGRLAIIRPAPGVLSAARRALTQTERDIIARAVGSSLGDSGAKFIWMPLIVLSCDGFTDYCGLVDSKELPGAHNGFTKFYVQLRFEHADPRSQLDQVCLCAIANPFNEISEEGVDLLCRRSGYGAPSGAR